MSFLSNLLNMAADIIIESVMDTLELIDRIIFGGDDDDHWQGGFKVAVQ